MEPARQSQPAAVEELVPEYPLSNSRVTLPLVTLPCPWFAANCHAMCVAVTKERGLLFCPQALQSADCLSAVTSQKWYLGATLLCASCFSLRNGVWTVLRVTLRQAGWDPHLVLLGQGSQHACGNRNCLLTVRGSPSARRSSA